MKSRILWTGLGALALCTTAFADTVEPNQRVQWLTSVTEGYYNDPANWTGGIVPPGDSGLYGYINFQANDVTIKAPPGGLEESSGVMFLGCGAGTHTLTIDTRGSYWAKTNVTAVSDWWGTPFASTMTGQHVFNFEGLTRGGATPYIWRFEDALFTWESTGTTLQNYDLRSGTFEIAKHLYLGSTGGNVNFYIHPDATFRSAANVWDGSAYLEQRGNATTHTWFLGGEHTLNGIELKDLNAGPTTTYLHVTNDASVTLKYNMRVAARGAGSNHDGLSSAIVDISENASMTVGGAVSLGTVPDVYLPLYVNIRNRGDLAMSGNARLTAARLNIGHAQCSTGVLAVADSAVLTTSGTCTLGCYSNAWGRLALTDNAQATVGGVLHVAGGDMANCGTYGELVMEDDAALSVSPVNGNWVCLGSHNGAGSVARFTAKGRSRLTASVATSVEMGYGFDADLEFALQDEAVAEFPGGYVTNKVPVGGRSVVSLADSATLAVRAVYGSDPATGDACMELVADGGTLKVSAGAGPLSPFLSGCVATLGADGLALDTSGRDVTVDQAFTAAAGASGATLAITGGGALTAARNSSHPKTKVVQGALVFGPGVTRFGNVLDLADGAWLGLADATARIEADSLVLAGDLMVSLPASLALDTAHPVISVANGITAAQAERIVVANPQSGRAYAFTLSGDGATVSVTVSAAAGTAKTWAGGASGDWNTSANWDPAGVPTHNDEVTVGGAAAISLSAPASVGALNVAAASASVTGSEPLYVADGVSVAQGGALSIAVPVRKADGALVKGGKGALALSGDNAATMQGNWRLDGGATEFASAASLGVDSQDGEALAVSNATFRYTGEAATVKRPWRLTGEFPAVFDVVGDLTFRDFSVTSLQRDGGFAKLGPGTLTLDVPAGDSTISWWTAAARKSNSDINGVLSLDGGEASSWDGLAQMTVLEGRLVLVGKGKNATTVKQEHHGGIGGSGYAATVSPELYLKDLSIWMGSGNGFHTLVGQQMAAGSAAPKLILDNADATLNGLYVGHSKANGNAEVARPVLAITNGTLNITWMMYVPNNVGGIEPVVRVGAGGVLLRQSNTTGGGIWFFQKIDARFEDGGCIDVRTPQNLFLGGTAHGDLVFARGGGMKVNRFLGQNTAQKAEIVLDGGYAEFTLNGGISTVNGPAQGGIRVEAGGGELIAPAGVTHALAIPLRGGHAVKTGVGTLVFTNDLSFAGTQNSDLAYTPLASSTVKIANTGGLEIAEGTVRCAAGTTDANSRFSGTGTLSGEFDAFTLDVEPGATDALTFADLTASRVTVDFGKAPGEEVKLRDMPETVVAKVATEAAFRAISWKGVNCGDGIVSEFRYDAAAGVVRARFRSTGVVIILR